MVGSNVHNTWSQIFVLLASARNWAENQYLNAAYNSSDRICIGYVCNYEKDKSHNNRLDGRPGLKLVWFWRGVLPRRVSRSVMPKKYEL
jgi:hypothetical protein